MRDFRAIGVFLMVAFFCPRGYLSQKKDGVSLVINPSGETQNQPAGKGFALTCKGQAEDTDLFSNMKWIGPRGDLPSDGGQFEVTASGSALILMFKSSTTEDSGLYNCSASYDNIDRLNTAVNLIFYQDITWDDCPQQQALVINSNGNVRCRVSANPPATITWTKDGQSLEDRYETKTDGIHVTGVTEDDKGHFSVRAMVPQTGRFQNRMIKVEVHVPPEIIELEDKAEATEGNEATLHCQASGFPRPLYTWFAPDQRDLSNVEGHIVDQDTGTITFLSVKRQDRGSYTCMAKNPAGDAKRSLDLSVTVKPEIKEFSNVTVVENQVVMLECHAMGDPLPEMSMRKDGLDRPFAEGDDRIILNRRNDGDKATLTLTIQKAIRADDGLYYCAAENKGAHVEKVGHMTVEFAPIMSSTPTTSVKTWKGNPVNLTCIAESIPNATITWTYLDREIKDGEELYTVYERSAHSNLLVRPPGEFRTDVPTVYGTYKCEATNPHGSQFINIELQEARIPSILPKSRASKETATTITFVFESPKDDGGLPVRSFVVKFREESQAYDKGEVLEWSEGTPYVLENLRPRTAYKFRFAARNDVGIGEWSDELSITTPAESSPEPPKFITPGGNVSTYPDRFQIRWTEPLDNGRKIDYFELRYFEVVKLDHSWDRKSNSVIETVSNWENAPMFEMKNLRANTYYKVEVRAHNDIGFSQDATMVFQTAADPSKTSQDDPSNSPPGIFYLAVSDPPKKPYIYI